MKKIIAYLGFFLASITTIWVLLSNNLLPNWLARYGILLNCILSGGIGGSIYCLRAVYINACVRKNWDKDWHTWYVIRPIVSLISGGISWLFLKAGLLILDAGQESGGSTLGFIAFAFIAGYNVDKFMAKIEQISEATWGIEKSRSANVSENQGK